MKLRIGNKIYAFIILAILATVLCVCVTSITQELTQEYKYDTLEDLRPCPFCGSTDITYTDWDSKIAFEGLDPQYEEVMCNNCGANTFRNKRSDDAVSAKEKWNRRK